MMISKMRVATVVSMALLLLGTGGPAKAWQGTVPQARERWRLPVTGVVAEGGTFAGTFTVQRFEARGEQVFAIGLVSGSVTSPVGAPVGMAHVAVPVLVGPAAGAVRTAAQGAAPQDCGVLHLEFGAINMDLLGLHVTTTPITADLSGTSGPTDVLGTLICTILETLGNVIALVGLLNQLLGLLGGLI
jgi:hypothetical protein